MMLALTVYMASYLVAHFVSGVLVAELTIRVADYLAGRRRVL